MSDDLDPNVTLWKLEITASGSVHDKDGNLLSGDVGGTTTVIVTDAEAKALMEGNPDGQLRA